MPDNRRIVLIGNGAIGRPVAERLIRREIPGAELAGVLLRGQSAVTNIDVPVFRTIEDAFAVDPHLVIEAAGGEAFRQYAALCLSRRIDFLAVSVAAMADRDIEAGVGAAITSGGGRLFVASGAIGALEALSAAREEGLISVALTQRKPLRAFPGMTLPQDAETTVSSGSARDAALAFPRNANISAAIAMAGLGFDQTQVTVIADPKVNSNIAELHAVGAFGEVTLTISNRPSDMNPSTARLAGLSVIAALRRLTAPIVIPA